jgi:hypothetical protein
MSETLTIVRHDVHRRTDATPWWGELIVGQDVDEDRAADMVDSGAWRWGPEHELPPALYLRIELEIRGFVRSPGTLLHIGGDITPGEALVLLRGQVAEGEPLVSAPGGGVG